MRQVGSNVSMFKNIFTSRSNLQGNIPKRANELQGLHSGLIDTVSSKALPEFQQEYHVKVTMQCTQYKV